MKGQPLQGPEQQCPAQAVPLGSGLSSPSMSPRCPPPNSADPGQPWQKLPPHPNLTPWAPELPLRQLAFMQNSDLPEMDSRLAQHVLGPFFLLQDIKNNSTNNKGQTHPQEISCLASLIVSMPTSSINET